MIFTDRTITINKGASKIDEPIVVYRGDYEVALRFAIMNSKFKFMTGTNVIESEQAVFGQLAILTPYGGNIFSDVVECVNGTVSFVMNKEFLDQIEEVGLYSFQIRLFDSDKKSRVSIPPVEYGIEIREPIASEDHDNEVNNAIVGYSIAKVTNTGKEQPLPPFNDNGDYNKTVWRTGDRITQGKLNKIEEAIDIVNKNEKNDIDALNEKVTSNYNTLSSTKAEKSVVESLDRRVTTNFTTLSTSKADRGSKISIDQIDLNKGKITEEYLDDSLIEQIAGSAAVNTVPANNSITTDKLADGSVTIDKLSSIGYIVKDSITIVGVESDGDSLTVSFTGRIWIYNELGETKTIIKEDTGDNIYRLPNWSTLIADLATGMITVLAEGASFTGAYLVLGVNNNGIFTNGYLADVRVRLNAKGLSVGETVISGSSYVDANHFCRIANVYNTGSTEDSIEGVIRFTGPAWITLPNGDYMIFENGKWKANRNGNQIILNVPPEMIVTDNIAELTILSSNMLIYNYGQKKLSLRYDGVNFTRDADDVILLTFYRGRIVGGAFALDARSDTQEPVVEYSSSDPLNLIQFESPSGNGFGKEARVIIRGDIGKIWYYCVDGTKIWYDRMYGAGFYEVENPIDAVDQDTDIFSITVPHNNCLVYSGGKISVMMLDYAMYSGAKILALCHEGSIKSGILYDIYWRIRNIESHNAEKTTLIPSYHQSHLEAKINDIKNKHITQGQDVTSFAFITDMHWTTNTKVSPALLGEVCAKCNIEFIFNGGDWVNNAGAADNVVSQINEMQEMFENNNILDKTMMVLGNHDDNSTYGVASKTILQPRMFDLIFRRISADPNVVMDSDADAIGYYYKDDKFKRIRYIVLNCIDTVYDIDPENDTIEFGGQHSYEFRKRQVEWFCKEALDVPDDKWNVVICSHIPPITENIEGSDNAPNYGEHLLFILDSFINKTRYSATASGGSFGSYDIEVDFTNKGGNVIAWLAGHVHYDNVIVKHGVNIVTTINNDTTVWDDAPLKTKGTHTEQAFDIFTINTKTRNVEITRIGAGSDRSFTY